MDLLDGLKYLKIWLKCFKLLISQENNVDKGNIILYSI